MEQSQETNNQGAQFSSNQEQQQYAAQVRQLMQQQRIESQKGKDSPSPSPHQSTSDQNQEAECSLQPQLQYFFDDESSDEDQHQHQHQHSGQVVINDDQNNARQITDFSKFLSDKQVNKIKELEEVFNRLSKDITCEMGKVVSKRERNDKNLPNANLTYGEVDFVSICEAFTFIQSKYGAFQQPGSKFMDLGHGTGKAVLTGCFMHQFEISAGIEILQSLQDQSEQLQQKYLKYLHTVEPVEFQNLTGWPLDEAVKFQVEKANILEYDWSDYDLILANSTCFELQLMKKIEQKASQLKKGSWFITLTQKLPGIKDSVSKEWECVLSVKKKMSWGHATIHLQRKVV